jgi:hypothetical protein
MPHPASPAFLWCLDRCCRWPRAIPYPRSEDR